MQAKSFFHYNYITMKEKMLEGFIVFLTKRAQRLFNHFKTEQLIIGVYDIVHYLFFKHLSRSDS